MRNTGYYWVQVNEGESQIASYIKEHNTWIMFGDSHWYPDEHFFKIDENEIVFQGE